MSSFKPEDFDIPEEFQHWPGDPAEDNVGPFFCKSLAPAAETAFRLDKHHCNMFGIAHGGVLMCFADYTLCLSAIENTNEGCLTLTCDNQFVSSAEAGELLVGRGELIRRTRRLAFVRATLSVGDRVVLSSTATLKMTQLEQPPVS